MTVRAGTQRRARPPTSSSHSRMAGETAPGLAGVARRRVQRTGLHKSVHMVRRTTTRSRPNSCRSGTDCTPRRTPFSVPSPFGIACHQTTPREAVCSPSLAAASWHAPPCVPIPPTSDCSPGPLQGTPRGTQFVTSPWLYGLPRPKRVRRGSDRRVLHLPDLRRNAISAARQRSSSVRVRHVQVAQTAGISSVPLTCFTWTRPVGTVRRRIAVRIVYVPDVWSPWAVRDPLPQTPCLRMAADAVLTVAQIRPWTSCSASFTPPGGCSVSGSADAPPPTRRTRPSHQTGSSRTGVPLAGQRRRRPHRTSPLRVRRGGLPLDEVLVRTTFRSSRAPRAGIAVQHERARTVAISPLCR